MATTTDITAPSTYTDTTASMQPDPEARLHDDASESFSSRFPLEDARCATTDVDGDWVPARERRVVPEQMAALCRRCDGRANCLLWALASDAEGYWAATTARDREQMRQVGRADTEAADWLQEIERNAFTPLHAPGRASNYQYGKGCRCPECLAKHTEARQKERAKKRPAAAVR